VDFQSHFTVNMAYKYTDSITFTLKAVPTDVRCLEQSVCRRLVSHKYKDITEVPKIIYLQMYEA